MTYQYDSILGTGRDGKVTLAEQQAGFDLGTSAQQAAFQSSVSGDAARIAASRPISYVCLGTSLTIGADTASGNALAYPYMLSVLSGGAMRLLRNAGVFGNKSNEILGRVATQVIPYSPDICFVEGYTNDSNNAYTNATTIANHALIISALRAANIVPIFIQGPPLITNATVRASQESRNAAVRAWNERNFVRHLNPWEFVVDPATGGYLAGMSSDNIHPWNLLYAQMAQNVLDELNVKKMNGALVTSALDTANKVGDGLFTNPVDLGAAIPTGWNNISGTNNVTSIVKAPSGWAKTPKGNVLSFEQVGTGTGQKTLRKLPSALPNRLYRFSCRFKSTGSFSTGLPFGVLLQSTNSSFVGGSSYRPLFDYQNDMEGVVCCEFVTDATAAYISVGLYGGRAGTSGGEVQFAQVCLEDLTALGHTPQTWPWV